MSFHFISLNTLKLSYLEKTTLVSHLKNKTENAINVNGLINTSTTTNTKENKTLVKILEIII